MTLILLAIFLGLVEGVTEFLPISSTGHLVLLIDLLGFQAPPGKTFEIVIQLGAILAICVLYRHRLIRAALGFFSDRSERNFVLAILAGFLPAMVVGAIAYPLVRRLLDAPIVVAIALVLGGIAIIIIERHAERRKTPPVETVTPMTGFKIGIFQIIAMIPGVSRSGATIMGALLMGVERKTAAEFSFFLAIPTMLGASAYSILRNWDTLSFDGSTLIAVGFVAAFIAALLVVRWAIAFIVRHGFIPFAWYRILLGLVILAFLLTR